jgi:DNA-directed RNA polymerase subunit L
MTKLDLHATLYDFIPHGKFQRGKMRVIFSGKDANTQFINSIGRIMMDRIPKYALARELIYVERIEPESGYRDSVAVNHDMISRSFKDLPIPNINPDIFYLHEKYWKGVDYLDTKRDTHELEKRIEFNLDVRNEADELGDSSIISVTTNDLMVYVDGELKELYDMEFPYHIIDLKPKEQIRLSAKAVLGVGLRDCCWQAASTYSLDEETEEGSVILMFKATLSFDEYALMDKALKYYKERTELIANMMEKKYLLEEDKQGTFIALLNGEDFTIGTPLAYEIQSHPDCLKGSCGMPDNLVDQIEITIVTEEADNIIGIIKDSVDNLIKKIEIIQEEFSKMKEETYSKYLDSNGKSLFYDYDSVREEDPNGSYERSNTNTTNTTNKSKKSKKK